MPINTIHKGINDKFTNDIHRHNQLNIILYANYNDSLVFQFTGEYRDDERYWQLHDLKKCEHPSGTFWIHAG